MIQIEEKRSCNGCTACSQICPKNSIEMKRDDTGFLYPQVDEKTCVECGLCEQVCPIRTKENSQGAFHTSAYAAFARDERKRENSASGAVFPLLAEEMIAQGGIVYGVCYEEQGERIVVCHKSAHTKEEAEQFYNAKYVQSHISDVFSKIEQQLQEKRKILFSGTPCQVAGLKRYLGKKNCSLELLYCVDNICHGVPSPKAWDSYVKYCRIRDGRDGHQALPKLNLRDKVTGWSNYAASVSRRYESGQMIREKAADNVYMRAFMTSLSLRPSCSSCNFKGYSRESDITLGDFWGIWKLHRECDDNRGTSAVLIHSHKGRALWSEIQRKGLLAICLEVPVEEIADMNRNLLEPAEENVHRDAFLRQVNEENFGELVNRYAPGKKGTLWGKCVETVRNSLRKIETGRD